MASKGCFLRATVLFMVLCLILPAMVQARFISVDPAASQYPSWSPYTYCKDNPLKYVDPDGRAMMVPQRQQSAEEHPVVTFVLDVAWGIVWDPVPGTGTVSGAGKAAGMAVAKTVAGKTTGKLAGKTVKTQTHHIATNKNRISSSRGGPWTQRFEAMFEKAGKTLDDAANKVKVAGHKGPHPEAYHTAVYTRLRKATRGLKGAEYSQALTTELRGIGNDIARVGSSLHGFLVD